MEKLLGKIGILISVICTTIVVGSAVIYATNNFSRESGTDQLDSVSYTWYHNIGDRYEIAKQGNYSDCDLLESVKPGDMVYERSGGFGVSGHIAIVEGIMESSNGNGYYIQTIEAISDGVVRSVLDCDRLIDRNGTVIRVPSATPSDIEKVIDFAEEQLGKKYDMKYPFLLGSPDCREYSNKYTCSQLAYCAYNLQGIDLNDKIISVGPIMPNALYSSKKTIDVEVRFDHF